MTGRPHVLRRAVVGVLLALLALSLWGSAPASAEDNAAIDHARGQTTARIEGPNTPARRNEFLRGTRYALEFREPPPCYQYVWTDAYYGYRWGQLLLTTLGGIRKDGHGRALDPEGAPIPGLYATGDGASTYSWLLSGGMGVGDAMAFGRIGARHAAANR